MGQIKKLQTDIQISNNQFLKTYNPANCLSNPTVKTIQEAFIDKNSPTLAGVQRQNGQNIASGMIKTWLIYLNETLNPKRPMTERQIFLGSDLILSDYYMLRFADLTVLFRNIIKGKYGSLYESLTIDKLLNLFEKYFEERCNLSETHNSSKSIEHRQNMDELGTERISKSRR